MFTLGLTGRTRQALEQLLYRAESVPAEVLPGSRTSCKVDLSADGLSAVVVWSAQGQRHDPPRLRLSQSGVEGRTADVAVDALTLARSDLGVALSDRGAWAAWTIRGRISPNPLHIAPLVNLEYGLGEVSPWDGASVVPPGTSVRLTAGAAHLEAALRAERDPGASPAAGIADALVRSLRDRAWEGDVVLSLTGGRDSRIIAAALAAAGVAFRTRTYGPDGHPDVVVAEQVARALGVPHEHVRPNLEVDDEGRADGQLIDVAKRIRSAVLLGDGGLSAFENLGGPDPQWQPHLSLGGQGGELLRGGYAKATQGRLALAGVETFRRIGLRRAGLLRRGAAAGYTARLVGNPYALATRPLDTLDTFYARNRAGRWSASARAVLKLKSPLAQPFFDADVFGLARLVPIKQRIDEILIRDILAALHPELIDIPFAGHRWMFDTARPQDPGQLVRWQRTAPLTAPKRPTTPDWRRMPGTALTPFLRNYVHEHGTTGPFYDVLDRHRVAAFIDKPEPDLLALWALATAACLSSGDWMHAREDGPPLLVGTRQRSI